MGDRKMTASISTKEAVDSFGLHEEYLYVCDGKKECGKWYCLDHSNEHTCHHTADESHAIYEDHVFPEFERYPSVRGGEAVVICVEPIR